MFFPWFLIGLAVVGLLVVFLTIARANKGALLLGSSMQAPFMCVLCIAGSLLGMGYGVPAAYLDQGAIYEQVGVMAVEGHFVVALRPVAGGSVRFYRLAERPPAAAYVQVIKTEGETALAPFPVPARSPDGPGPSGE